MLENMSHEKLEKDYNFPCYYAFVGKRQEKDPLTTYPLSNDV